MIHVQVNLFGSFRRFGDGQSCQLKVPQGSTIAEVQRALARHLAQLHPGEDIEGLVNSAVLASDEEVFPRGHVLDADATLAVLPPVCGG